MSFLELAKRRYSVRAYIEKEVENHKLQAILEAGRVAPTGANLQPQHIVVVQGKELDKLNKSANTYNAPVCIVVCSEGNKAWKRPFDGKRLTDIDATIVTDHMMMAATDLGLGSVWICYFDPELLRAQLNIPADWEPINILAIGYADTNKEPKASCDRHSAKRKPLEDTVEFLS